ncbi:MAG: hypothetical protein M9894_16215 [Planctomycetes bacterium]|nr:hypothetical protein [Planctomycetota bacterium]
MSELFTTPDGLMAVLGVVALLLSIAGNLLQASGRADWAARAEAAERLAGVGIQAIERAKGKLGPDAAKQLVEVLREDHVRADVEVLARPALERLRAGAAPEEAVREASADARRSAA